MFDALLQPKIHRALDPLAARLATMGIKADTITVGGFTLGVAAAGALAVGAYYTALILILMNRLADGLDGILARRLGPSDRGTFLDIALDFFFYAMVPVGFALADPGHSALPAAVLLLAFMGTASSFLAFAAVAGARRRKAPEFPNKGIYYLGGLTEGAETIALFIAMCIWPNYFPAFAYMFAALCFATTFMRWRWGWLAFSQSEAEILSCSEEAKI